MKTTARLDEALREFDEAVGRGEVPDRAAFLAKYSGIAGKLRRRIDGIYRVAGFLDRARPFIGVRRPRLARGPFGEYEILTLIAWGGMGEVYLARRAGSRKLVALKVMLGGPRATLEDIHRFKAEARAVMTLDHPNIVSIVGFDVCQDQLYLAMNLVRGGSLDEYLPRLHENPPKGVRLMVKVARAVHYAHRRGILHRDLKPGNILLNGKGAPVIVDWGLAKRIEGGDTVTKNYVLGTPDYMAPELLDGSGSRPTTAVDVYGLGVILYELLAGRVPYPGGRMGPGAKEDPPSLRSSRPDLDPVLGHICMKCLRFLPEERYDSAGDLAEDLQRWLEGREVNVDPPVVRLEQIQKEAEERARRQALLSTARAMADRVLMRLKDWSYAVVETSNDPVLADGVKRKDRTFLRKYLMGVRRKFDGPSRGLVEEGEKSPVESWFVLDERGTMLGYPVHPPLEGKNFSDREWFRRAFEHQGRRGQEAVHVSRVFRSVVNRRRHKFSVSVPIYDGNGDDAPAIGVVGASFTTDSDQGIQWLNDGHHKVVVAGRADLRNSESTHPGDFLVLMHPAYRRGERAVKLNLGRLRGFSPNPERGELRSPEPGEYGLVEKQYKDPMAAIHPGFKGAWWAGIAPVGNTNLIAIVQRRPHPLEKADLEPEVAVGHLSDRTGHTASVGDPYAGGVEACTDWINAQGGINGKKIRLVSVDLAGRIPDARQIYSRITTGEKVVAIQGWGTGDTEALMPQVSRDEIPYLSASYSARLADPRKAPYNFFVGADYSTQLRAGLKYLRARWKRRRKPRVAFLYPNTPYGRAPIADGRQFARKLGFEVAGEEHVELKATEAVSQVLRLRKRKPDVTWIGGTPPSTAVILKDARRHGLRTRFLVNVWGNDRELIPLAGRAVEGVIGLQVSAVYGDDVPGMKIIRGYAKGEHRTPHFVRGWVSMMVLGEALIRADFQGELTGPGIKRALESLEDYDPLGLTPPITYTAEDHRPTMSVRVYEYSGGRMRYRTAVKVDR